MLRQNSREELNNILQDNYISESEWIDKQQEISLNLKNKVNPIKINKLFNGIIDINMFTDKEIYFLCKQILNYPGSKADIAVNKFFTKIEIENYENVELIDFSKVKNNHIVLNNVVETLSNKLYQTNKVLIKDIVSWSDNALIGYDFNAQRPPIKYIHKGKIKTKINVNWQSVKEIKELIIKQDYPPAKIVLCVVPNGYEKIEYKDKKIDITSDDESRVIILDGFHNLQAAIMALRENPDVEQYYDIDVYRMDLRSARNFIYLKNKQNLFKPETANYYDTNNVYNLIVDDINNYGTNAENLMKNKIGRDYDDIKIKNQYCLYSTLSKAIQDNFEIDKKNIRETRLLKEYLINFFNELISIFNDEFKDIEKSRKRNFITYNKMFYGYISLASKLYKQENWQDKLFEILSEINFDKNNKEWKDKKINSKQNMPKQLKLIYNYFICLYDDKYGKEE